VVLPHKGSPRGGKFMSAMPLPGARVRLRVNPDLRGTVLRNGLFQEEVVVQWDDEEIERVTRTSVDVKPDLLSYRRLL
jgi:hypothetical protein